jgi:DNA-binding transcriptional ArsR family regulator
MSVTVEIAGLPPERIVFSPSPLAELGTALHALSQPEHHPTVSAWATSVRAALTPDVADRLSDADFLWNSSFADVFVAFAGLRDGAVQPGVTLAEDLDLLDRLEDEEYVAAALEFTCSSPYGTPAPSPLADRALGRRALELAAARGPRQVDFTAWLLRDPSAVRAWMRRLFEDCDQAFFADTWQGIRSLLAADARHKTELLRHKGVAAALEAVSPAVSLGGNGTRIVADKLAHGRTTAVDPAVGAGVTFVPTTFNWPHLLVLHRPGWRPIVHYPIAAPGALAGPASVEQLTRRMAALSHPLRMRLCINLTRAPYTTGELAERLGITAPEVSRQLAVLKKAGLLTLRRRGRYVLHQLDVSLVSRLGSDFLETVLR